MEDETWTWIDKYGTFSHPTLRRLCTVCKYRGYFELEETKSPTPNWPFMEVCPKCGNRVECDGVEMKTRFSKELRELAERVGKAPQELSNEACLSLIMEFDHKTGKVRLVRRDWRH